MNNIIKLFPPQEDKDKFDDLMDKLKENTDQIIFIQVTKEGNIALGRSPLEVKDLIVMYYHIQKYIQALLESTEEDIHDQLH